MLEHLFCRQRVLARIRRNPIGSVLEEFVKYLSARGYKTATIYHYLFAAEHFGQWLDRRKINCEVVVRFLRGHLPSCHCNRPAPRKGCSTVAALNRLLEMLGQNMAGPRSASFSESLLQKYADHLTQVQGLASVTVHYRLRYARTMLSHFRVQRLRHLRRLTVDRIRQFVAREGRRCCPASGQVIASSIRSCLRFLLLHRLVDHDLAPAVPAFANWRPASGDGVRRSAQTQSFLTRLRVGSVERDGCRVVMEFLQTDLELGDHMPDHGKNQLRTGAHKQTR